MIPSTLNLNTNRGMNFFWSSAMYSNFHPKWMEIQDVTHLECTLHYSSHGRSKWVNMLLGQRIHSSSPGSQCVQFCICTVHLYKCTCLRFFLHIQNPGKSDIQRYVSHTRMDVGNCLSPQFYVNAGVPKPHHTCRGRGWEVSFGWGYAEVSIHGGTGLGLANHTSFLDMC